MTPFAKLLPRRALPSTILFNRQQHRLAGDFRLAAMSLFASRQTLLLILPENGPNAAINEQLATLVGLLHDDLLLIVRGIS